MLTYVLLIFCASALGFFGKYADLINEHGMKPRWNEPHIFSGILWGASGIAIMKLSPIAGVTYTAHILYWFLRVKLEYPNHALAGVMIVLYALCAQPLFYATHSTELFFVFLGYVITGYLHAYFLKSQPKLRSFLRLRFRIYLVPLLYSLYCGNLEPFLTTLFGMIACEITTYLYRPGHVKS